jgi:hypothetical protein
VCVSVLCVCVSGCGGVRVCVCVLLSCVLLCSAQPTHLNIVACDPRHAHSVVPGPCMSGHTVLAQRERERSREKESERERERARERINQKLVASKSKAVATAREASRESVSGARQTRICLPWEPALGVYVALAGSLRGLVCATWRVCTTSITVAETGPCARAFTGACVQ